MSGNNADGAATHSGAVGSAVNLSVPPLAELQMRRSDKWAGYGPGVISATIAEMDFPLADPIVEVLHAAIGRHDLGYTPGDVARLAEAFEGFAARRLNWTIDPGQVTVVTDVMMPEYMAQRMRFWSEYLQWDGAQSAVTPSWSNGVSAMTSSTASPPSADTPSCCAATTAPNSRATQWLTGLANASGCTSSRAASRGATATSSRSTPGSATNA
jgi:hypothetical protein